MKKILFVASHRKDRAPGQRFRFEQYFNFIEEKGFQCRLSYLLNENDDKLLYQPGNYFSKMLIAAKAWKHRWNDVVHADEYDIIFIFREAFLTGSVFFEKQFRKSRAKIVFDFDDAIWHLDVSDANKKIGWLKDPGKTARIIGLSDLVIAGNKYLAGYAKHHNKNVVIIPTTIDTEEYKKEPVSDNSDTKVCIGWSGSITTIKHFEHALPFLKEIKKKYGAGVEIRVIGDESYKNDELEIKGIRWTKKEELPELSKFDIGIMPLPDDEWAKGKCGLKGLQYMALGIPCIMSPVGVNSEIISDGVNGYLASGTPQWVEKLSLLIENSQLRQKIGQTARQTVIDKYSVISQQNIYLNVFTNLLSTE